MYEVYNPTLQDITVSLRGIKYTAPLAGTCFNVPKEDAEYWQENLHSFLKIKAMKGAKEVEEKKEEKVEEVKEVIVEEATEEVVEKKATKAKK